MKSWIIGYIPAHQADRVGGSWSIRRTDIEAVGVFVSGATAAVGIMLEESFAADLPVWPDRQDVVIFVADNLVGQSGPLAKTRTITEADVRACLLAHEVVGTMPWATMGERHG